MLSFYPQCDILMVLFMKNIPHSFAFIGEMCLFCLPSYSILLFTIIFLIWIYIFSLWLAMWWNILVAYNVFDEMPQWSILVAYNVFDEMPQWSIWVAYNVFDEMPQWNIWLIFNWFLFVRIRKSRPGNISWLWAEVLRKREWKMKCEILNFDGV